MNRRNLIIVAAVLTIGFIGLLYSQKNTDTSSSNSAANESSATEEGRPNNKVTSIAFGNYNDIIAEISTSQADQIGAQLLRIFPDQATAWIEKSSIKSVANEVSFMIDMYGNKFQRALITYNKLSGLLVAK